MFIELLILFFSSLLFSTNFIEGFMMTEKDEKIMTQDTYNRARNFSNIEYNNNKRAGETIKKANQLLNELTEVKKKQDEYEEPEITEEQEEAMFIADMLMKHMPSAD